MLSICVLPDYRGHGVSENMLHLFETLLRKEGVENYTLSVQKQNDRAIAFYRKHGFQDSSETREEYKLIKRL